MLRHVVTVVHKKGPSFGEDGPVHATITRTFPRRHALLAPAIGNQRSTFVVS